MNHTFSTPRTATAGAVPTTALFFLLLIHIPIRLVQVVQVIDSTVSGLPATGTCSKLRDSKF